MRNNMINYVRIFVCLLLVAKAKAGIDPLLESARADFQKTNEAYTKLRGLSIDTYYMVYSDHQSKSVIEAKNGRYVKFKDHVYTKIDDVEIYAIDDKLISIYNDTRLIAVADNKANTLSPLQSNLDSLLGLCESIKVEQVNANEKKYKLYFEDSPGSEFSRADIQIDTKNSRYVKIVLFYNVKINLQTDFHAEEQQPRLEIIYKNYKILEQEPLIFNQELYISTNGSKLKPAGKYYNFKVTDLRNETRIKIKK